MSDENARLQAEVRELKSQARQAVSLGRDLEDLHWSLRAAHTHNEKLEARHRDEIDRLNEEIARERETRGGTQRWDVDPEVGVPAAGFEQQDTGRRVFAEARRQRAPGGTGADDDVVMVRHR